MLEIITVSKVDWGRWVNTGESNDIAIRIHDGRHVDLRQAADLVVHQLLRLLVLKNLQQPFLIIDFGTRDRLG